MSDALAEAEFRISRIKEGKPLPSVMLKDKTELSPRAKYEINQLMKPNPKAFIAQAALAWSVIFGAIAMATFFSGVPVKILAVFIIATRQNILGLLVHEQAHFLGFKSKAGELLANLISAYPILISVDGYAKVHLAHHQFYFTEKDPDYLRKQGDEWDFPMPPKHLVKMALKDLTGANTLTTLKGKQTATNYTGNRKIATPRWVKLVYYFALGLVFTLTHTWTEFLIYWMLPLLTVLQVIVRWGALCEHKYNLRKPGLEKSTPLIQLKWWEKILLPNLNFTLHIYHHYYPGISFKELPKVHKLFQRERMINEMNVFRGYGEYLHYLVRSNFSNPFSQRERNN